MAFSKEAGSQYMPNPIKDEEYPSQEDIKASEHPRKRSRRSELKRRLVMAGAGLLSIAGGLASMRRAEASDLKSDKAIVTEGPGMIAENIESPGEVIDDPGLLGENPPTSVTYVDAQNKQITYKVDHYERRPEGIVAVDAEGHAVAIQLTGKELYNDWYKEVVKSTDTLVPFSVLMSDSLETRSGQKEWIKRITSTPEGKSYKMVDSAKSVLDASFMDGSTPTLLANKRLDDQAKIYKWKPLPDVYGGKEPVTGQDVFDGLIIEYVHKAKGISYEEALALLKSGKPIEVKLSNGQTWDVRKGIRLIIRDIYSPAENKAMNARNSTNTGAVFPEIGVGEDGVAEISVFLPDPKSGNINYAIFEGMEVLGIGNGVDAGIIRDDGKGVYAAKEDFDFLRVAFPLTKKGRLSVIKVYSTSSSGTKPTWR